MHIRAHIEHTFTRSGKSSSGDVLVLLNSLGTTQSMWERQVKDVSQHFDLLRYDIRGHGGSEATFGDYSMDLLAGDLLALLDELDIEAPHLCGLSLGGMVALTIAVEHPSRLKKLVVCNTHARTTSPQFWNDRIEVVRTQGLEPLADAVMGRFFSPEFALRQPEVVQTFRKCLIQTQADGYAGCCAAIRDFDVFSRLAQVTAPTLVIGGARDLASPPAIGEEIARNIAGSHLAMLNAAHISNVEAPEEFTNAVLSFLDARASC